MSYSSMSYSSMSYSSERALLVYTSVCWTGMNETGAWLLDQSWLFGSKQKHDGIRGIPMWAFESAAFLSLLVDPQRHCLFYLALKRKITSFLCMRIV
jgi:hypothetical protein